MDAEIVRLKKLANNIRENIVEAIASIGVGHIGGCLSIADVLAVLYGKHMRYDPKNPKMAGVDLQQRSRRSRYLCGVGGSRFLPERGIENAEQGRYKTAQPLRYEQNSRGGYDRGLVGTRAVCGGRRRNRQ